MKPVKSESNGLSIVKTTKECQSKQFNSKKVPRWLIRYEKLFKIVFKISILYLIINMVISSFSLNLWFVIGSIVFFVLSKVNLLTVEICKGFFSGFINERANFDYNPTMFHLAIAVRMFQIILYSSLLFYFISRVNVFIR